MRQVLLVRYGEVFLKGANRPHFLKVLTDNIKRAVKPLNGHVWLSDARVYVSDFTDLQACVDRVSKVFGVYSVSPALEMEKDLDVIGEACVQMMAPLSGTFKVLGKRSDKKFPMNSMELAAEIGHRVLEANPNLRVDVHTPEHRLTVEIRDNAYICVREILAVGGMPTGTGGKAALLLSGGIDSPVAGYQLMKRGVRLCAIHFQSPPYTGELAKDKVLQLAKKLAWYSGGMRVYLVPFTKCQLEIHEKCPEELGTLITRRFMMRIAERIAKQFGALALITGESLGQVASQTMEALCCTDAVVTMPVFRPLIGLDKTEIMAVAEKIDTYETSILPYEDCCTVFTPRHPVTKPKLETMPKVEEKLDVEALVSEAVEGTEMVIVE
ncbi:MAG: tRNA 4-thiouridine(8) synthase ThiI [Clostridia bacterium]|nr:tRNA 4-thiouridine(8) synthase ThiI [Clostridia bacterium]MBR6891013.1 tRNA 4-thiouridine(8) synthase ThiI [Clostridia bacterium]